MVPAQLVDAQTPDPGDAFQVTPYLEPSREIDKRDLDRKRRHLVRAYQLVGLPCLLDLPDGGGDDRLELKGRLASLTDRRHLGRTDTLQIRPQHLETNRRAGGQFLRQRGRDDIARRGIVA